MSLFTSSAIDCPAVAQFLAGWMNHEDMEPTLRATYYDILGDSETAEHRAGEVNKELQGRGGLNMVESLILVAGLIIGSKNSADNILLLLSSGKTWRTQVHRGILLGLLHGFVGARYPKEGELLETRIIKLFLSLAVLDIGVEFEREQCAKPFAGKLSDVVTHLEKTQPSFMRNFRIALNALDPNIRASNLLQEVQSSSVWKRWNLMNDYEKLAFFVASGV